MCGRSVEVPGIVLVVNLKTPREVGGEAVPENLEMICEECNAGKEAYFQSLDPQGKEAYVRSLDPAWLGTVTGYKSVHVRIGETLKAFAPQAVPAATLKFVADQAGWKKRARELRYLGWDIHVFNRKLAGGRVSSFYQVRRSRPWPEDPTGVIRQYERDRAEANRRAGH